MKISRIISICLLIFSLHTLVIDLLTQNYNDSEFSVNEEQWGDRIKEKSEEGEEGEGEMEEDEEGEMEEDEEGEEKNNS